MNREKTSSSAALREALLTFWGEQLRIEETRDGLLAAMPLMDAAGWQVVLRAEPATPGKWLLSDGGKTLGLLDDAGKNPTATGTREAIGALARFYGFEREGLELQKVVAYPFDACEVQVFAEGLAAVSHLCPKVRHRVAVNPLHRMEERMSTYFYRRSWTPKRHHKLSGKVEAEITVDFYVDDTARPLALQPVGRQQKLRAYMEQWGWRWTDLGRAHPDLLKVMVFDRDNQDWDDGSLKIGEQVCDVFVPYQEAEAAMDAALSA